MGAPSLEPRPLSSAPWAARRFWCATGAPRETERSGRLLEHMRRAPRSKAKPKADTTCRSSATSVGRLTPEDQKYPRAGGPQSCGHKFAPQSSSDLDYATSRRMPNSSSFPVYPKCCGVPRETPLAPAGGPRPSVESPRRKTKTARMPAGNGLTCLHVTTKWLLVGRSGPMFLMP